MSRSKSTTKQRRPRRKFTPEFKADFVRLCQSGSEGIGEVARRLDLTETAVRAWVKQADVDAGRGAPDVLTTSERGAGETPARTQACDPGTRHPKESHSLLRQGELVTARYAFIEEEKASFSVSSMCRALEVSASGYYDWRSREPSERQRRRDDLAIKVRAVHHRSNDTYGSPRVRAQLVRMGETVSEKTVAGIMQQEGLRARRRKRYKATTDSRGTYRIAPNLLARDFTADAPNQIWVTDATAIWTLTGWVYLAAILDRFARPAPAPPATAPSPASDGQLRVDGGRGVTTDLCVGSP